VYDVMTRSPRVIITATDLVRAKPFSFTREQLNGVCVDPKSVPVARAVFASAATPIYFAPLVMQSFAGRCGYQPPDTITTESMDEEDAYRRERAERLLSFLDSRNYPYLHLADGAFADNLGARAILDEVALGDTVTDALRRNGYSRARRMLFIVVDARTGFDRTYARRPEPLGIKKVMDAVVSATFNRYSFETMNLLRARVKRWERDVRTTRCKETIAIPDCDKFDIDLVELSFDRVRDDAEREYLDRIPTAFTLSSEQIIRLRRAAQLLVEEAPEMRTFLEQSARSAREEKNR
jgi:NTE family protein